MSAEETLKKFIPDDKLRTAVVNGFTTAIGASFLDEEKSLKRDEVKRRYGICVKIFTALVGDLRWSTERALHHLPEYLRAEVLGIAWTPSTKTSWTQESA